MVPLLLYVAISSYDVDYLYTNWFCNRNDYYKMKEKAHAPHKKEENKSKEK